MPPLDAAAIRELQAAVLTADLTRSRDALLAGIDSVTVARLPTAPNPAAQITEDIAALNNAGTLIDKSVPLLIWLANAAHMASMRHESAVFKRYQDRVSATASTSGGASASAGTASAPVALSRAELVKALGNLLAAQFEILLFTLDVPTGILSAANAPQVTRSIEVIRWAEQGSRLDDVRRALAEVTGK